ncbi:hypothetical protein [Brunnivagina elsteri]|uniref:Uncharacterized protein n=1 Tax=Brunnivagina elsteri CCALA 953 TaxID=987040 RepID=A0A2A2TK05_9CYAN|nr:hypothetical protein [Calothrix elsteri]PAX56115.1 hypothetical protein CK510_10605 [Calothrix elsteri CCALA 953]
MIPLIIFAVLLALDSPVPEDSLTIQPWGKVYHIAYSMGFGFDTTYREMGLFECDRMGLYCWRIHSFRRAMAGTGSIKYDPKTDRMTMYRGSGEPIYVRSRSGSFEHRALR